MSLKLQNFKTEKYLLIFWLLFLTLLFINFRALSFYQINDDFFLYAIASGVLYGFSSADAIFISSPLNSIFKVLFENFSQVNWYYEFTYLNLYFALAVFSLFLYKKLEFKDKLNYLFFIVANLVPIFVFIKMFYLLQFSQTAIVSAAVGVMVLIKSNDKLLNLSAILLVLLGFSWRSEAAILATALVVGVYLTFLILNKDFTALRNKKIYIVLSSIAILFIFKSINFLGYAPWQSDEKNEFRKLNYDIMRTYDFSPTKEVTKLQQRTAKSIGWSQNDYNLYVKTYFADENIYSVSNLDKLAREAAPQYSLGYFAQSFIELSNILTKDHSASLLAIIIFLVSVFLLKREKKYLRNVLTFLLFFAGFIFLVYLLGKIPNRIYWPLGFVFLISMAGLIENSRDLNKLSNKIPIAFAALALAAASIFAININTDIKNLQWWKQVREDRAKGFDRVLEFESDKPIVAFSSFYSPLIQSLDPSSNEVDQIFRDMVYLNWATRSADYNTHLDNLNMNRDLFSDIAEGRAYLATANLEELQMVNQYLIEHKNITPIWDEAPFVFTDTGLGVWKIVGTEKNN